MAYPVGFGAYPVGFAAYPVGFGPYPVGLGAYPVGFEGKISIGASDIFNGGVKNPMGVLKRVNGGNGGIEKDQWGHWSGSMGVLKRVNGVIGQGQWG